MPREGRHLQLGTGCKCFREGVWEIVAFEDWVGFCPRNVDGQGELEGRWYQQRLGGRTGESWGPAGRSPG